MSDLRIVEALIVGRTKKGLNHVCIGALDLESAESLRLLEVNGDPPLNSLFQLGETWRLEISHSATRRPPFVEDVVVHRRRLLGKDPNPRKTIESLVEPWKGGPVMLFDDALHRHNGRAFVDQTRPLPDRSTWFWTPSKPLTFQDGRFFGQFAVGSLDVKYVGFQPPRNLTTDDLLRLSLAYWWSGDHFDGERCYLQISGWF